MEAQNWLFRDTVLKIKKKRQSTAITPNEVLVNGDWKWQQEGGRTHRKQNNQPRFTAGSLGNIVPGRKLQEARQLAQ